MRWLERHDTSPLTGAILGGNHTIAPNFALRSMIASWKSANANPAPVPQPTVAGPEEEDHLGPLRSEAKAREKGPRPSHQDHSQER